MYIEEVLKNSASADMVPCKIQGLSPPPPPPLPPTVTIVQEPPTTVTRVGNSASSSPGTNVTEQKTYSCIPITTELLKSVVLKPAAERNFRKRLLARWRQSSDDVISTLSKQVCRRFRTARTTQQICAVNLSLNNYDQYENTLL